MTRPHLVLIGMMGAGKSTVGQRLASRLGRPFLDSDHVVEERTGRTVAQIFRTDGEIAFREVETEVLGDMLDDLTPSVIAAAGGAVLDERNRARMRARGTVVWLRVDPDVLVTRVQGGAHRPLLDDDPSATLQRLAQEREGLYSAAAHEVIDVGDDGPDAVAARVIDRIGAAA